jgi:amino acid adenylation domain-containing protein
MNSRANIQDVAPLTGIQEGLYFQSVKNPDSFAYFQQIKFLLAGELDSTLLADSFQKVVNRHDVLRTIVTHKNAPQPLMVFLKEKKSLWQFTDLTNLDDSQQKLEIEDILKADLNAGFNFAKGDIFRVHLIKTSDITYELVLSFHHLLIDGLSFTILHRDLFEFYRAGRENISPELKPVPSYSRYLAWWKNRDHDSDQKFWAKYLDRYSGKSEIPSTVKKPEFEGQLAKHTVRFNTSLSSKIEEFSRETGVTRNHLILSIWGVLLSKLSNREEAVFGITINGRPAELPGIADMIGLFINTVPIKIDVQNVSFASLVQKTKEDYALINDHQYLPLADIQNLTPAGIDLLQHILVFEGHQDGKDEETEFLPGVKAIDYSIHEQTHYALEVSVFPEDEIRFRFGYDPKRFSEWDIQNLGWRLEHIASELMKAPNLPIEDISSVPDQEKKLILESFADGGNKEVESSSLVEAFERICEEKSEEIAISDVNGNMTFSELNELATNIAANLKESGVQKSDRVVLLVSRSRFLPAILFGVLKSGAAYVPLSKQTPIARIKTIVEDVKPALILTDKDLFEEFADRLPVLKIEDVIKTNNTSPTTFSALTEKNSAYVIYTSGSTGRPKGVEVTHGNLLSFFTNIPERFGLKHDDRFLALTTYTFDISGLELLGTTLNGTELVISDDSLLQNPNTILRTIKDKNCNALQITPSHLAVLLESDDLDVLRSLRLLLVGGEALPEKLASQLSEFDTTKVINVYGPTETTIWSTSSEVTSGDVTIGKPLLNESAQIVKRNGDLAPIGVKGNLFIGGEGVSNGYWQDEEKSLSVFKDYNNDFIGQYYDTGDRARWLPDGTIEFFGRSDNQIKIRGFRVELGEIEQALSSIIMIKHVVVVYEAEAKLLHAFYISDKSDDISELLRSELASTLPSYMIPATFSQLDSFPLSSSGKVDRKELLKSIGETKTAKEYEPPLDDEEILIAKIFDQLFPDQTIGRNSNFFELGGHSLKAMALVSRVQKITNIELPLHEVFRKPLVKDLAALLRITGETTVRLIPVLDRNEKYELSHSQRRFWVIDQLEPECRNLNLMGGASLIKGTLNRDALRKSFDVLMSRHEVLRTTVAEIDGAPFQIVNDLDYIPLFEHDFSNSLFDRSDNYNRALDFVYEEMDQPFDLSTSPLWKIVLIRIKPDEHLLLLKIHHIICDASSINLLENDFSTLYQNYCKDEKSVELENIKIQQKDYSAWQNSRINDGVFKESEKYWKELFTNDVPVLDLPQDYSRPTQPSYEGETISIQIPKQLQKRMVSFAKQESITLFTLFTTITSTLISRIAQQEEIVLLSPVSGRNHPDLEKTVGLFVNTLPLKLSPRSGISVREYLNHTNVVIEDAVKHSQFPFDMLVDLVEEKREINRPPISGVMLVLDFESEIDDSVNDLKVESIPLKMKVSRNDMTFNLFVSSTETKLSITYSTDLFKKARIVEISNQWKTVAEASIENPGKRLSALQILENPTKNKILGWSSGRVKEDQQTFTIHELFDSVANKYPDSIAIQEGDSCLKYGELKSISDNLANTLSSKENFEKQRPVAVLMDRSANSIITMLAIMKAGGIYLPLEKKAPDLRNRLILEQAEASLLIVDSDPGDRLKDICLVVDYDTIIKETFDENSPEKVSSADSAYLIFTSGSTGIPKGVLVAHHSFVNMINYQIENLEIEPEDKVLQFASLAFDASLAEIFQALCSGATLSIASNETIADPNRFLEFIQRENVSVATLPPAYLNTLNHAPLGKLRVLMTAGDTPILDDVRHYRSRYRYFNAYGPTEFSVCATLQEIGEDLLLDNEIPMGRAVNNSAVYVLDKNRQLLPPGIKGEIYLAGKGIAKGYINRPDESDLRFIDDPFHNGWKMYQTGDLGVWNNNGELFFKGRIDFQVKIRGHRIEVGEIENRLRNVDHVEEAVVLVRQLSNGRKSLSAYLKSNKSINLDSIRNYAVKNLPDYMIPSDYTQVDEFPLNLNGKIDRVSLLNMKREDGISSESERPLNDLEEKIAKIWKDILEREITSPLQHFFKSGGDSLAAIQMTTLLSKLLNKNVPIQTIFKYPVLSEFAIHTDDLEKTTVQSTSRKSEQQSINEKRSSVKVYHRPLEELVRDGKLTKLDSVALSYYSNEIIEGSDLTEEEFLKLADPAIHLRYHITTQHGAIGIINLPRFTSTIYEQRSELLSEILEALILSGQLGATHVSLTGLIPSATDYGQEIVGKIEESGLELPVITTGHDATAATVIRTVEKMLATSERKIEELKVAFLGMGSVGKSVLELMLDLMPDLQGVMLADLYLNEKEIEKFAKHMMDTHSHLKNVKLLLSEGGIREEIYDADLIIGATNVPDLIDVTKLKKGAMIVDDSGPHCFSIHDAVNRLENSKDILFTEGGALQSNSPFDVSAFLSENMENHILKMGSTPFEGFPMDRITGCVLSGLIAHSEKRNSHTTGAVAVSDSRNQYLKLKEWEVESAPLHIGAYEISEVQILEYLKTVSNKVEN